MPLYAIKPFGSEFKMVNMSKQRYCSVLDQVDGAQILVYSCSQRQCFIMQNIILYFHFRCGLAKCTVNVLQGTHNLYY